MIIAATGHRPDKLGGYTSFTTSRLFSFAHQQVLRLKLQHKDLLLISGMAQGWDQAIAEAAIAADVPFIAAVPFAGQEKVWPHEAQKKYKQTLQAAQVVELINLGAYAAWKNFKRNKWMVDHADNVLALWDGSDGGTGGCVAYANEVGKPVENVWEQWNEFP